MHERIVETAQCTEESRLRDHKPAPTSKLVHTQYVDNFIAFGPFQSDVREMCERASEALRSSGLVVHEEVSGSSQCAALGWTFEEPSIFRPSRKRVWKTRLAVRELLSCNRCSGQVLEHILGHL